VDQGEFLFLFFKFFQQEWAKAEVHMPLITCTEFILHAIEFMARKQNGLVSRECLACFRFKDDATSEEARPSKKAKAAGSSATETGGSVQGGSGGMEVEPQQEESWPGPWSTASDLYKMRDSAAMKRKQGLGIEEPRPVKWTPKPKPAGKRQAPLRQVPTLQEICLDFLAHNISACIPNGLGAIGPDLQTSLCEKLCAMRKLQPDVLPMFTEEGETSELRLPDCSYLGEQELSEAIQRIKGPTLEIISLRFCGRGMCDKLIDALCKECPNIRILTLGGCYRVTDKGIAGV
jgi:hypothetical protein